jgi:beta-lactam-binding protein with PASTA domain
VLVVVALIGSSLFNFIDHLTTTPTSVVSQEAVPDLIGMAWSEALNTAKGAGFQLKSYDGSTEGVVTNQNPLAGRQASTGSLILVQMAVQKTTIPSIPKNSSLTTVEQMLRSMGFMYRVIPDGTNPNLQPNTVSRINPSSGSLPLGSKISIYVVNYYINGTPVVTPNP